MPSRSLDDLHPSLRELAEHFIASCHQAGVTVLIYCTYRNYEEQDAEYAKGRTAPGPKVTNAKAGESPHNATLEDGTPASLAFDCCPLDLHGKPNWDSTSEAWRVMALMGESIGLQWGGRFKNFDGPHFQMPER